MEPKIVDSEKELLLQEELLKLQEFIRTLDAEELTDRLVKALDNT